MDDFRVYGPYFRKDNRQIVILVDNKTSLKTTVSYPKFLYEKITGLKLGENETIHHIDGNPLNNDFINLEVILRSEHASKDALRIRVSQVTCPICKKMFAPTCNQRGHRAETKAGPFCSKECAGYYGASVQNGAPKIGRNVVNVKKAKLREFEPISGNINSGVGNIGESPVEKRGNTEGTNES